ncbi:hypothetical protein HNQ64_001952 [Prosthecobacter dejongeii]|uniref:Transposase DDE domain-containing protein n=1 Tax=Prosthecobacter dejongeii TaxID=48465 RepID=A0A7W7YK66_9BACT|nr:hypothetical protein [Prosthecobacter dejongeii]
MYSEKNAQPSAVILEGRTMQSTPESGVRAGYDGYKHKKRLQSAYCGDWVAFAMLMLNTLFSRIHSTL